MLRRRAEWRADRATKCGCGCTGGAQVYRDRGGRQLLASLAVNALLLGAYEGLSRLLA